MAVTSMTVGDGCSALLSDLWSCWPSVASRLCPAVPWRLCEESSPFRRTGASGSVHREKLATS